MTMHSEEARRQPRPHGLLFELARAAGWLTLEKGVSKLPKVETVEAAVSLAKPGPSPMVKAIATLIGIVLAMVPREATG